MVIADVDRGLFAEGLAGRHDVVGRAGRSLAAPGWCRVGRVRPVRRQPRCAIRTRLDTRAGQPGRGRTARHGCTARTTAGLLWSHAQPLPGGLPVVAAPAGADYTRAALSTLLDSRHKSVSVFRGAATVPGAVVIADCGRLDSASPAVSIAREADRVLLLVRPRADELNHLAAGLSMVDLWSMRPGLTLVGPGYPPTRSHGNSACRCWRRSRRTTRVPARSAGIPALGADPRARRWARPPTRSRPAIDRAARRPGRAVAGPGAPDGTPRRRPLDAPAGRTASQPIGGESATQRHVPGGPIVTSADQTSLGFSPNHPSWPDATHKQAAVERLRSRLRDEVARKLPGRVEAAQRGSQQPVVPAAQRTLAQEILDQAVAPAQRGRAAGQPAAARPRRRAAGRDRGAQRAVRHGRAATAARRPRHRDDQRQPVTTGCSCSTPAAGEPGSARSPAPTPSSSSWCALLAVARVQRGAPVRSREPGGEPAVARRGAAVRGDGADLRRPARVVDPPSRLPHRHPRPTCRGGHRRCRPAGVSARRWSAPAATS